MSEWDEGAPYWAPTKGQIQTWDSAPQGVSRGRGFAPAGRGRGIAKWSSQGNICVVLFGLLSHNKGLSIIFLG